MLVLTRVERSLIRNPSFRSVVTMGRTRRRQKQQHQGNRAQKDDRDGFPAIVKQNEEFNKYYKRQTFIPENEWEPFLAALAQPLPTTFRVTGASSRFEAQEFMRILQRDYFPLFKDLVIDDEKIEEPAPLPWYPFKNHAWKLSLGRNALRKNPKLNKLHACIRTATESGHISRQEAVSMIPPLLLDVKSHHKVLDMCAAPGSKTAQMVEMLHDGCDNSIPVEALVEARHCVHIGFNSTEGYVIANDIDNNRCYTMTHQIKRLQSPCVIMINENAASMPAFLAAKDSKEYIFFDRILADVPCSGDGTMRKNLDIWNRWNIGNGRGLHTLQKRILFRGIRMLAVGGRIVYSTCSFNPLEDEAVVAAALRVFKGCVRLVEVSDQLPGLQTVPGVSKWTVYTDNEGNQPEFQEMRFLSKQKYRQSMWPPSGEEANDFKLDRCLRLLPHHNDTGGFFIAVLEKVKDTRPPADGEEEEDEEKIAEMKKESETKAEMKKESETNEKLKKEVETTGDVKNGSENKEEVRNESEIKKEVKNESETNEGAKDESAETKDGTEEPPAKKRRFHGYKEDPFIFFKEGEIAWPEIRDFYQLTDQFPYGQFLGRCEGPKRNIYFTSKSAREFMDANAERFKVINLGVKALSRNDSPYCECKYRLTQDAISVLSQFVTKRVVHLAASDITTVLSSENPFVERLSESAQAQIKDLKQGGLIFKYTPKEGEEPQCSLTLCGWKGLTSVRSFTPKLERQFYLLLCGNNDFTMLERPRDLRKAQNGKGEQKVVDEVGDSDSVTTETVAATVTTETVAATVTTVTTATTAPVEDDTSTVEETTESGTNDEKE